jgi:elongation factor 3
LQNSSLDEVVDKFRQATEKATLGEDDADSYGDEDDDGAEEICDLRFNLAYGGKILLHQTKLRLLRGHRYGLVGQNGAGKTTLMTAITNGKLEGWPTGIKTAYVDSGSNVDPDHEARYVLDYLQESTGHSREDCIARLEELKFTQEMREGTIGSLSGGWQMKLRLIRAVLLDADVLLLDEPTYVFPFVCVLLRFTIFILTLPATAITWTLEL